VSRRGLRRRPFAILAAALLAAASASASGFYTPDIGAQAVGRGAAWIVGAGDLTAIYLNPAGLARAKGTRLQVINNFMTMPTSYRRGPTEPTVHNRNPVDVIQFLGLSSDFGLKRFTFALAFYGPYGVAESYSNTGPQRYQVAEVQRTQVYYVAGAAWAPLPWLRVGVAGGVGEFAQVQSYAFSPFGDGAVENDVIAKVRIRQFGTPAFGAGVQVGPFAGFEFGGSYEPETPVKMTGTVAAYLPPLFAAVVGEKVYMDDIAVTLRFPQTVRFGIRQQVTPRLDLEFDAVWIDWSVLKEQKVDLKKEELMEDFTIPVLWRDTWNFRLGGEFAVLPDLRLRAGGWYDQSATRKITLKPGSIETDRWAVCAGLGYTWKGITLDLAYSHVFYADAEVRGDEVLEPGLGDPRGTYRASSDLFVAGVTLDFNTIVAALRGKKGAP
jgi:long-chain fatty acid transport protein